MDENESQNKRETASDVQEKTFLLLAAGIAFIALTIRVWVAWTTHFTAEDYLITLRYAQNLAHGNGLTFNIGERVLGTTTPLYTLILAVFERLHWNALAIGKSINIVADAIACFLLARLLAHRKIGLPIPGIFAAALYCFSPLSIKTTGGGMETGLVTCLCLAILIAFADEREWRLAVLGSTLFLFRIDTLPLTFLMFAGVSYQKKRIPIKAISLGVLIALPWLIFSMGYFGTVVPNTITAKIEVYRRLVPGSPIRLHVPSFAKEFWGPTQRILTALSLLGVARVLFNSRCWLSRRTDSKEGILILPLVWLMIYYGAMLASPVPTFYWYFLPPYPLYLAFAAIGASWLIAQLAMRLKIQSDSKLYHAWVPLLALLVLFSAARLRSIRAPILEMQAAEDIERIPMSLWLRDHIAPGERILLEPIGYVGYYSGHRLLDMIGLVSPEALISYRQSDPLADLIRRQHPENLLLRNGEINLLNSQDSTILQTVYIEIRTFAMPDGSARYTLFHRLAPRHESQNPMD